MTLYQTKTFSTGPKWLFILIFICVVSCKDLKNEANDDPLAMEAPEEGFVPIFDGKTLEGWLGDPQYWRVENGNLVGEVTPSTLLKTNTFIIWQDGQPSDFELKLEFRIAEKGNSGVNYRSELVDSIPYALRGYQADIDGRNTYTGQNYEERKRTTLAYRGESTIINAPSRSGSTWHRWGPISKTMPGKTGKWSGLWEISIPSRPRSIVKTGTNAGWW